MDFELIYTEVIICGTFYNNFSAFNFLVVHHQRMKVCLSSPGGREDTERRDGMMTDMLAALVDWQVRAAARSTVVLYRVVGELRPGAYFVCNTDGE